MLKRFSALLCEVFRSVETTAPEPYALGLLRLLCAATSSDSALLGVGMASLDGRLPTARLALYNCPAAMVPALCGFAGRRRQTDRAQRGRLRARGAGGTLSKWLRQAGLNECIFVSTAATADLPQTWLALLRKAGRESGTTATAIVSAVWPHLLRALDLNRQLALETCIAETRSVGHALLGADYRITTFDPAFRSMFAREWPGRPVQSFPQPALRSLSEAGRFDGRLVLLELSGREDRLMCTMTAPDEEGLLTPAERKVAMQYARGRSSKEIAQEFLVSENTVRTHLAHIFDKMGIHRKADLIHRLGQR